jgi:hypothetical protein
MPTGILDDDGCIVTRDRMIASELPAHFADWIGGFPSLPRGTRCHAIALPYIDQYQLQIGSTNLPNQLSEA